MSNKIDKEILEIIEEYIRQVKVLTPKHQYYDLLLELERQNVRSNPQYA